MVRWRVQNARKKYKKRSKRFRATALINETRHLEGEYKEEMNKSIRKHRENMIKKINNLKSTNPNEYWIIIMTGIKQNNYDIAIDVFLNFCQEYEFFNSR